MSAGSHDTSAPSATSGSRYGAAERPAWWQGSTPGGHRDATDESPGKASTDDDTIGGSDAIEGGDATGDPDAERPGPSPRPGTGRRKPRHLAPSAGAASPASSSPPTSPPTSPATSAAGRRGRSSVDTATGEDGEDGEGPFPGRRRRRWALVASGLVVVALAGVGTTVAVTAGGESGDGGEAAATAPGPTTVPVEVRTLEEHTELDGTLGYGDVTQVALAGQGTITGLPELGSTVDRGQSLLEVDSHPVPLLFGDRPMWRELRPGIEDGADVQQLEANLVALGIVTESELTVDTDWTDATTDAVQEWQESLGRDETGRLGLGDLVFLPGKVRVAEHPVAEGSPASGQVLGVTGLDRTVTIDLEATRQSLVAADMPVEVVLPDGTTTAGTIRSVGSVATDGGSEEEQAGGGGDTDPTIEVVVALDDPAAAGDLDRAPVTVRVVTSAATDVTAVPVEALLALAEGGYAVEVARDGGTTELVAVELGAFAGGWVEVTGEVAEGDEVVVPGE